jgi:hypothetical protein
LHWACRGELHVTWQRLPLFSALHDVVELVELIEFDVLPALVDAETVEEFSETAAVVAAFDSTEPVTFVDVREWIELLTAAA